MFSISTKVTPEWRELETSTVAWVVLVQRLVIIVLHQNHFVITMSSGDMRVWKHQLLKSAYCGPFLRSGTYWNLHASTRFQFIQSLLWYLTADYDSIYKHSISKPDVFWADRAKEYLHWEQPFDTVMEGDLPGTQWFRGGKINASGKLQERYSNVCMCNLLLIGSRQHETFSFMMSHSAMCCWKERPWLALGGSFLSSLTQMRLENSLLAMKGLDPLMAMKLLCMDGHWLRTVTIMMAAMTLLWS